MRFAPIVTQIFLWRAIFEPWMRREAANNQIVGYSYHDMVAYYLLVMIGRAFSSMPGLATGIARDIRTGVVKKYLIQPIDMLGFLLLYRMGHKLVYYGVAVAPFALVFFLCRGFFPGWPDAVTLLAFFASLAMCFLLGFFLEAALGMIGFWFLEVSSLLFVYMLFSFFFSGHMFPLDMLPGVMGTLVKLTPFPISGIFSHGRFFGQNPRRRAGKRFKRAIFWVLLFFAVSRLAFYYGTKRYSGIRRLKTIGPGNYFWYKKGWAIHCPVLRMKMMNAE